MRTREVVRGNILSEEFFAGTSPGRIAEALKRRVESGGRGRSVSFRRAMAILDGYLARTEHLITPARRELLSQARWELRRLFHRY